MQPKNNTKHRNAGIQGLRSFKDTLPKNVKKIIKKRSCLFRNTEQLEIFSWKRII